MSLSLTLLLIECTSNGWQLRSRIISLVGGVTTWAPTYGHGIRGNLTTVQLDNHQDQDQHIYLPTYLPIDCYDFIQA
ncbi:hypothetical protein F4778DRAFT_719966 [Xylariomycetidae sp. FL2044]|nr:hypothetical protein F4778DRAFT_719966 [Xylariomycetidae sp. FL2044]